MQLRLRVTRRSWQKLCAGKNFVKILVTAQKQLRSYSEQQSAFGNSNICNCERALTSLPTLDQKDHSGIRPKLKKKGDKYCSFGVLSSSFNCVLSSCFNCLMLYLVDVYHDLWWPLHHLTHGYFLHLLWHYLQRHLLKINEYIWEFVECIWDEL